ncbi:Polyketide cyclase / dehydrase and lipid transport [Caulifigura coniformis]|uniref:Polyketide cyclase / dehydrase and lipid transport n=1 Tax=Caulifigura coniformis TaxID=2527983 RepID=A0A517SMS9_9PLAN|nr:SRPBCC family protein [Caulifigura coniformis]QDT57425.1 Polyketide cyclase / dehydrase and lipid transport [Caulifigura coniformis]
MPLVIIEEDRRIEAPAEVIYGILADYRAGHPSILPPAFSGLVIEEGGYGAGTRIRFTATMMGMREQMVGVIEEPEPGRVLIERYPDRGTVTSFTIDPEQDCCRVTIRTEIEASPVSAFFQRLFVPRLLRGVFRQELANLDREATRKKPGF